MADDLFFRLPVPRDIERLAFEGRISMEELCRRADVHSSTFRHWRSGRSSPSIAIVKALLDAGMAAMKAAERAGHNATPAPHSPRRKAAAKRAKPAAAKRPARRRA
jgi:transposase-like protein